MFDAVRSSSDTSAPSGNPGWRELAGVLNELDARAAAAAQPAPDGRRDPKAAPPFEAIVAVACDRIPGAEWASITVRRRTGQFETVAASDTRAVEADEVQYRLGSGPCVDAVVDETVYCPHDLRHDARWPQFGPAVSDGLGVNSMLAYRMSLDGGDLLGCLNVYATAVDAFGDDAVALGEVVATHAALLISDTSSRATVEQLRGALATNREIGVAMGVLMLRYKVTREEAFGLLRLASQNLNRKLRDIATEVADTGDLAVHRVDRPRSSPPTGTS